ncbi:MAG: hydrogenase expression/formation protein HypE, partial [Lachnospiraceae bacterium]|nr:hydrogenase expression/formation protein HypE [Lachnospiraceae bacterium]
ISMAGGIPRYLSASFIIEEGLPMEDLERIIRSAADTARSLGVSIVTGDTKVVEKGKGDGIYINTSGIGFLKKPGLSPDNIRPGDVVILSGTAGDHGAAVMLARNGLGSADDLLSDCAPLCEMAAGLYSLGDGLRVLRDPTRGGVATTLCEFADGRDFSIELSESSIPVKPAAGGICDMLGLDPLYCANEGKLIAVVSPDAAKKALDIIKAYPQGAEAAIIGRVCSENAGYVTLKTASGGSRILTRLTGAQLPRIC